MRINRISTSFLSFLYLFIEVQAARPAYAKMDWKKYTETPKLILFIVIDQFRPDYLTRYHHRFISGTGKNQLGGFRYLTENGAWFPQGKFEILQNMTGPGHATVLTGAYPYLTGIPINEWYDVNKEKNSYCVGDLAFNWIGGNSDSKTGTSPKNLIGTTLGDELKNIYPKSRMLSLSLKDRSAILMGGKRADFAVWFDPNRFQWTSTKYYFEDGNLPPWLKQENDNLNKKRTKLIPMSTASSKLFPKEIHWEDKSALSTPAGITMTEELSERIVDEYKLGEGKTPDIFAISFSSHDYAGHTYGPESQVMEEMTIAEDLALSKLFNKLNKKIPGGMKNVVVVLTADHGVAPNPELMKHLKIDAHRLDEDKLKGNLNVTLEKKYGAVERGWILQIKELNIYLNRTALSDKKVTRILLENTIKEELLKLEGIAHAFSLTDYNLRQLPPGIHEKQILNSYFPGRSGDVVAILKPYSVSGDDTANHQTGYAYDKTVPIIFAGKNISKGVYPENIEVIDIAPTLAALLGILPPSQSEGRVLSQILGDSNKP